MIRIERQGAVLEILIDRPERRNALTDAMYRDIERALREADADPACAALILHGARGELTTRIDQKAEAVALEALARRLDQAESRNVAEARINRILLCRLAEIRPDSYCEGFR